MSRKSRALPPSGIAGSVRPTWHAGQGTGNKRPGYGTEIEPRYVDVVVQRWQAMTGGMPVLDGGGRSWPEITAERRAPPSDDAVAADLERQEVSHVAA